MGLQKKELKDVISQNISDTTLKQLLSEVDINEIDSIYKITDINLSEIHPNPNQPRRHFDDDKINELSESIKNHGLFTPIMVNKDKEGYMIVAGERRYRASIKAGKKTIKCIICKLSDKAVEEIALIENVQRENLNAIEEANAYQIMLQKYNYTHEQLSARVGKSREYISNVMRLLKLPDEIKQNVLEGKLTNGHARSLLSLENTDEMIEMMNDIITNKLSVRTTEKLVKEKKNKQHSNKHEAMHDEELERITGGIVTISNNVVTIKFKSREDMREMIEKMKERLN